MNTHEVIKLLLGTKDKAQHILKHKPYVATHWNTTDETYINNVEPEYDSLLYVDLLELDRLLRSNEAW